MQNLKINLRLFQIPTLYPVDINFQKLLNYKSGKILYSILIIKICSKIF